MSRIWNVYYDRLLRAREAERFLNVLSPQDHVATFEWLFPQYAASGSNRLPYLLMLARLQEHNAQPSQALDDLQGRVVRAGQLRLGRRQLARGSAAGIRRLQPR